MVRERDSQEDTTMEQSDSDKERNREGRTDKTKHLQKERKKEKK